MKIIANKALAYRHVACVIFPSWLTQAGSPPCAGGGRLRKQQARPLILRRTMIIRISDWSVSRSLARLTAIRWWILQKGEEQLHC